MTFCYIKNKMSQDLCYTSNLVKQFLCCTPLNIIDLTFLQENIGCLMNTDVQKEILKNTVSNDLIKKYPVKRSYQVAFLKWFLTKIETGGGEIHEDIYSTYCNLISSTLDELVHYRHFLIGNSDLGCVTLQENVHIVSEGTTGLCSWQGAVELSKWCIENKRELCGKVILELGCGVGLTGLSVIRNCSPKQYIFTDGHKSVLEMVSENIRHNLSNDKEIIQFKPQSEIGRLKLQMKYDHTDVKVLELKWEDINKYIDEDGIIPDIIFGVDILYDNNLFPELLSGLKALLSFTNNYAIIAAPLRNMATISQFLQQLDLHNLCFEEYNIAEQTICIQSIKSPIKILKIFNRK